MLSSTNSVIMKIVSLTSRVVSTCMSMRVLSFTSRLSISENMFCIRRDILSGIDEVSTGGASRTVLGADCAGMMIVNGKKTKQHNDAICLKYRIYVEFILIWALRESSNSWQI